MYDPIAISEYTFRLPEDRIARYPLADRDQSGLLIYRKGKISKDRFFRLSKYLPDHSQLFFNNSRVIHARLIFRKKSGAKIEVFCLNPFSPVDYSLAFSAKGSCTWQCMVGNLKKWKDEILHISEESDFSLRAKKLGRDKEGVLIEFQWDSDHTFGEMIEELGIIPIPPYLNRPSEEIDNLRYQTVYSKHNGSVAAPTAGLHFTETVMDSLHTSGVNLHELTLHVGAGTFQAVKTENALDHIMHTEHFSVSLAVLENICDYQGPIIATGTTTLRCMESLYWLAAVSVNKGKVLHSLSQWDYRNIGCNLKHDELFQRFVQLMRKEGSDHFSGSTAIMITPGYRFKVVEGLITNYHQPGSTLLLLIAAFIGEDWRKVYNFALKNDFRFLSYGDSSLLWRNP